MLLQAAKSAPVLSAEVEADLARQAQQGSSRASEILLNAHLRLVLTIARDFTRYGVPFEDLVGEGLLALVEASRRFDPERGVRLAAYAAWSIRAYMRRHTLDNRRIVRAPSSRHGRTVLANLRRTQRDLTQACGGPPAPEAVARVLGVGVRDVEEMESALSNRDVSVGPHDKALEVPSESPSPETLVAEHEDRQYREGALGRAFESLTARERRILKERYLSGELTSLASIGRELGLSRERVRQLELQAHAKIKRAIFSCVA